MFPLQLILWLQIVKKTNEKMEINIFSVTIFFIIGFQYLGFGYLNSGLFVKDKAYLIGHSLFYEVFIYTSIVIHLLILGYVSVKKYVSNKIISSQNKLHLDQNIENIYIFIILIISITSLIIYINRIQLTNIPLLQVLGFTEQANSYAFLRSEMTNNFQGKYHWFKLFMHEFMTIATVSLFVIYLNKRSLVHLIISVFGILLCIFSLTMTLEKGLVIQYFISLMIAYILVDKKKFFLKLLILTFFLFGCSGILYLFFHNLENYYVALNHTVNRILISQIEGLFHYLEIFPTQIDYLMGASFPNPRGLFPWTPISISQLVANTVWGKSDIQGSIPTFFWGEMYANFGYPGIFIPPFFIGTMIFFVDSIIKKFHFSPLVIAVYVWLILHYKDLSMTGLSTFLFDFYGFFIILVLIFSFLSKYIFLPFKK